MPNFIKKICRWFRKRADVYAAIATVLGLVFLDLMIFFGAKAKMDVALIVLLGILILVVWILITALLYKLIKKARIDDSKPSLSGKDAFLNCITLGIRPLAKTIHRQKVERKETGKTLDDYTFIDCLKMTSLERFALKVTKFFFKCAAVIVSIVLFIPRLVKKIALAIAHCFSDLAHTMKHGDAATRLNFLFLGSANIGHKQVGHGLVLLAYQALYFFYLFYNMTGINHIIGLFTLGTVETSYKPICAEIIPGVLDCSLTETVVGDDSAKFLLFGILGVLLLIIFLAIYLSSNRRSMKLQEQVEEGRKPQTFKEELLDYTNSKFHRLILAAPLFGIFFFTVLPLLDMILMAFTNYDMNHQTPTHLFTWTGFETFKVLFGSASISDLFWPILSWTIIWAIFATVTN